MDLCQEEVTTLHDFQPDAQGMADRILSEEERPTSVVMPMLSSELRRPAFRRILESLNRCTYLKKIIIPLATERPEDYRRVVKAFRKVDLPTTLLWCNGERITKILEELKEEEIHVAKAWGKGRDSWIALGVASLDSYAIALHDADIDTYSEVYPAKLLFPLVERELDFFFNKAYYARISRGEGARLYGRVFRLFHTPFLKSLQKKTGYRSPFLRYLSSFRYALSGEFALTSELALNIRVPMDWGLEIGILTEVYRHTSLTRVCQTDLGFYQHKHRRFTRDATKGLRRMAGDIEKTLLRALTEMEGIDVSEAFLLSLQVLYRRMAQDDINRYWADAVFNSLRFDRHEEEKMVDLFSKSIREEGKRYLANPAENLIPSWMRVLSVRPEIREELVEAAEKDLKDAE
jgi:glucosyl-3-phosphoglycerate synthase